MHLYHEWKQIIIAKYGRITSSLIILYSDYPLFNKSLPILYIVLQLYWILYGCYVRRRISWRVQSACRKRLEPRSRPPLASRPSPRSCRTRIGISHRTAFTSNRLCHIIKVQLVQTTKSLACLLVTYWKNPHSA